MIKKKENENKRKPRRSIKNLAGRRSVRDPTVEGGRQEGRKSREGVGTFGTLRKRDYRRPRQIPSRQPNVLSADGGMIDLLSTSTIVSYFVVDLITQQMN